MYIIYVILLFKQSISIFITTTIIAIAYYYSSRVLHVCTLHIAHINYTPHDNTKHAHLRNYAKFGWMIKL